MASEDSLDRQLESAIRAARAGQRGEAYQLLRRVIDADPSNESAWLWLAVVAEQPREARLALRRVEKLNPDNPRLAEARRWLNVHPYSAPAEAQPATNTAPEAAHPATEVVADTVSESGPTVAEPEATAAATEAETPTPPVPALVTDASEATLTVAEPEATAAATEAEAPTPPVPALVTDASEAPLTVAEPEATAAATEAEAPPLSLPTPVTDASEATLTVAEAEMPEPAVTAEPSEGTDDAVPQPRDTKPVPPVTAPAEPGAEPAPDGDTAPRQPVTEETPVTPPPARQPRPACRLWVTILLALALATALAMLVFVLWYRFDANGFGLLPSPTPDAPLRALALQPGLNAAIAESRWGDAVAALEAMHAIDPTNAAWQHNAANAYYQLGAERRRAGDLAGALTALDKALALAPDAPSIMPERRRVAAVLEGLRHYNSRDWADAIALLTPVYREDARFADVAEWLYSAYYNLGMDAQAAGHLAAAQTAYQSALALKPDRLTVRQKVEEVTWLLRPPTPTLTPTPTASPTPSATPTPDPAAQIILVDISDQRMYVYENGRLLWEWVVSTGEPGKDTAPGRYQILDKIDVAYASTWNLDMPYWLGIYYSGTLEDGIHALPINRASGTKLWEGLLGQRVSFGCVILSDENARTLFEWAQVGTPVVVQW